MGHFRTWFSRCGGVGLTVGYDDLRGLFWPQWLYDCKILWSLENWCSSRCRAWLEVHASGSATCRVCCSLQDQDGSLAWPREALTGDLARPKGCGLSQTPAHPWWTHAQPEHIRQPEACQVSSTHRTLRLQGGNKVWNRQYAKTLLMATVLQGRNLGQFPKLGIIS